MRGPRIVSILAVFSSLVTSGPAPAADATTKPAAVSYSASVLGWQAFESDLEQGGSVSSSRLSANLSVTRRFVPAFSANLSLGHELQEWRFRDPVAFGAAIPWGTVVRSNLALGLNLALSPKFVTGVSPFVDWSYAREAGADDALTWGVTVSAFGIFSPRFTFGAAVRVQEQFYSTKISPSVIVNWQFAEKWRLANATSAGPLGGGGVELRHTPGDAWEWGVGGVYRSARYRLASTGPGPGDVGETGGILGWARLSRTLAPGVRADLHAGGQINGRVERTDPDGNELAKDDISPVPMLALSLSARW